MLEKVYFTLKTNKLYEKYGNNTKVNDVIEFITNENIY